MPRQQVIEIHCDAPPKPALGAPCNGCGLCCLAEPCPVGIWVSKRRKGACAAVRWQADAGVYRCGLLTDPAAFLPARWARFSPALARWARRWIAAGIGCDAAMRVSGSDADGDGHA